VKSLIQRAALTVAILVLEVCWLSLLMYLLNVKAASARLNVPGLFLVYLLAFGASWLMLWFRWPKALRIALNVIGWAVFSLLVVKIQLFGSLAFTDIRWLRSTGDAFTGILQGVSPELVALVCCAVLWWFGQRMATLKIDFNAAVREFQFGLLVILIVLALAAGFDVELSYSVPIVLLFFSAALLSLSLAHAQRNRQPLELYGGNWTGMLLISISVILILGLIIGAVITPDLLQLAVDGLQWLWGMIVKGVTAIVSLFPEPEMPTDGQMPDAGASPPPEEPDYSKIFVLPEAVRTGLRYGWYLLMIGFFLFFLWRVSEQLFSWLRERLGSSSRAEFESLPGAFRTDIQALFRRLFAWLTGWRGLLRRRAEPEPREISSVRQLYRQLLRWAAERGLPRPAFQTAYEYLDQLQEKLPAYRETLQHVTRQYVNSRYGHVTPSVQEMEQLKRSWHLLRHQHIRQ